MTKILIKGGSVVSGGAIKLANVLIENDKILSISEPESDIEADEIIDASGKVILPGLIDAHVHLREPGEEYKEGFNSGSKAALHGGVTTVLDMPNNKPPILSCLDLEQKRILAAGKMYVNYGFYIGFNGKNLEEVNAAKNIPGVKLYTTHSTGNMGVADQEIEELFRVSNKRIVVHAEDNSLIETVAAKAKIEFPEGEIPASWHSKIRSGEAAEIAVERACSLAKKYSSRLHIAHVSTKNEVEVILKYRKEIDVSCEVAPHHLFLSEVDYDRLGKLLKVNPPVREMDDVNFLWQALSDNLVDIIATDHAPHTLEEKNLSFWDVPSGVPELDTLLPLMLNAVNENRLTLPRLVALCCEQPAKVFGLKNKGALLEGKDADIVIVDMNLVRNVEREKLYSKCGWSPYEGEILKGGIVKVFVRGVLAFDDGVVGSPNGREVLIS